MAKAKAEAFKLYQFRDKRQGAFLETLRESFRKNPADFQARWRCRDNSAGERKARESDILRFGRRMLEVATFQASTVNRDFGHDIEGWGEAARGAAKASAELRSFLSSAVKPTPQKSSKKQEQSAAEAAPQGAPEGVSTGVLETSWLQLLAARREAGTDLDAMRQEAKSRVQVLKDAAAALDEFSHFTRARYRQLKDARKKTGHPQKRKFAVEMMRG